MTTDVAVIIPVHDLARPLVRTVRSVLAGGLDAPRLRVLVVAHNLDAAAVRGLLAEASIAAESAEADRSADATVTVLELHDGERSPAGPRQHALDHAAARYVSFVDSDDTLEPGALAAWLALADRDNLDAVIAVERHARGGLVRNPPLRPGPHRTLDGVRDRLVYRTALRGLFALEAIRGENLRFTAGGTNGSDQPFTLRLWHSGRRLSFASRRPAYVLGDDAPSRVTQTRQPLSVELAAPRALLDEPWFAALPPAARTQAATKIVRIHLLPQLAARLTSDDAPAARATARELLDRCGRIAPDYRRSLARVDDRIVGLLLDDAPDPALLPLLALRRRFVHPRALLPTRLTDSLRRDAPLRLFAAAALLSLRAR